MMETALDINLVGATCRTPAEHRAIVAKAGTSSRAVLAWPTAERLRHNRDRLALLLRWRDLMEPPPVAGEPEAADDGRALVMHRVDRPTVLELVAAAMRPTYLTIRRAKGVWEPSTRRGEACCIGGRSYLGALVFHDEDHATGGPLRGELIQWSTDRHGRPMRPYEKITMASRGGRRRMPPGTRQRRATEAGGDWGLHRGATRSLDDERGADAFDDVARQMEARAARDAVGALHALVLDLGVGSATARHIGEAFGHAGKYAERKGVALVDAALRAFGAHVGAPANDNISEENRALAA